MPPHRILYPAVLISVLAVLPSGCATLGSLGGLGTLIQPLSFAESQAHEPQVRVLPPDRRFPRGGATLRLWTDVRNPNPFGLRLSHLAGELFLEGSRAATGDFPLGLPLRAHEDATVPIDLTIGFDDVPALGALTGRDLEYRFDGEVTIDAGALGQPTFGPSTILRGRVRLVR
jgi:hypothetical protein